MANVNREILNHTRSRQRQRKKEKKCETNKLVKNDFSAFLFIGGWGWGGGNGRQLETMKDKHRGNTQFVYYPSASLPPGWRFTSFQLSQHKTGPADVTCMTNYSYILITFDERTLTKTSTPRAPSYVSLNWVWLKQRKMCIISMCN